MTSLLDRAVRLLSQRDHSEAELRRKLGTQPGEQRPSNQDFLADEFADEFSEPEISSAELEQVIDYCRQKDWLNDSRFASAYVSGRSKKGYGAQKVRMELMQKGIDRGIIDAAFAAAAIDQSAQAQAVAWKKFGQPLPTERLEKIKVQRFLLSRGFSVAEIQSIYINS